ncbi:hypothetical protein SDC9_164884 [bioreactor metagenome]|uniref:Uncharacterized protein n=1 Tax=bioreactor metagenome TaxID=1076179 RepID=A0A645FV23_9ZZZZ
MADVSLCATARIIRGIVMLYVFPMIQDISLCFFHRFCFCFRTGLIQNRFKYNLQIIFIRLFYRLPYFTLCVFKVCSRHLYRLVQVISVQYKDAFVYDACSRLDPACPVPGQIDLFYGIVVIGLIDVIRHLIP